MYSLLIGLAVTLFVAVAVGTHEYVGFRNTFTGYLVLGVVVALGTFFIIRHFFIRYLERNISPLLETLQSYTLAPDKLRKEIDRGDVVQDLNREVRVWADNQAGEIRKLRELEKYRKDFLGNVSHELKTPIFNIQGYLLTLLDGGMEDERVNRLYLKRTEKSINRLISILEDLDAISRLESGEFRLQIETFNLLKVVEEVMDQLELAARQQNIRVGFDSNYNRPVKAKADRKRIQEVVSNLVSNSIKYGREGGRTTISLDDSGEKILVEVSDDGLGIEEKDLPRIFERFFRVDKSRSRESGGTGLGLSIVKHTIQAHGQTITVRSKVGKGTTFVFTLDKP